MLSADAYIMVSPVGFSVRWVAAVALVVTSTSASCASKHLLLDSRTVSSVDGAELVPGDVVKDPRNPLISDANSEQMRPWEVRYDNMQPNIFFDQGKYRLWYSSWTTCNSTLGTHGTKGDACAAVGFWPCSGVAAPKLAPGQQGMEARIAALMYAESDDGIVWSKPALGVITDDTTVANKTDFGQNNIVVLDNTGTGVLVDEHAPAAQRYKLFGELKAGPGDKKHSKALAMSADGIHWDVRKFAGVSAALDRHGTVSVHIIDLSARVRCKMLCIRCARCFAFLLSKAYISDPLLPHRCDLLYRAAQ